MGDEPPAAPARLQVQIESADLDEDEVDRLTRQLRTELRDYTDADEVDFVRSGQAPAKTKAGEVLQLGDLAVTILPAAVPVMVAVVKGWLGRHQQHDMKVVIKVGDRAVDLQYPVGAMTRDDVMNLVAIVRGTPTPGLPEG